MAITVNNKIDIPDYIIESIKSLIGSFVKIDVDVVIDKQRKKRSLSANAFYWTLLGKLSKALKEDTIVLHNMMLRSYGVPVRLDGSLLWLLVPDTEEAEENVLKSEDYHLRPTTNTKVDKHGKVFRYYMVMKGSSTYTTDEMSALISGLINDCRNSEIPESEIMTSYEKEKLKELYGKDF